MGNRKRVVGLKPICALTESEWVQELEHIENQLTHLLDVFNFLEEIVRLSNESEIAFSVFNEAPLFWNVFRNCLQESMFMGLGRLCDNSSDTVNVRRVLNGAMQHPEFFSAEALKRRFAERNLTDSLANYLIEEAWIPGSGADFQFLKKELSSHFDRIEKIYKPIRDTYYAHRLIVTNAPEAFEKTNRLELGETLDKLRMLIGGLRFFYVNGAKPRVDLPGPKALDLIPRRIFHDMVKTVAGREL